MTETGADLPGLAKLASSKFFSRDEVREEKKGPDYGLPPFALQNSLVIPAAQATQATPATNQQQ